MARIMRQKVRHQKNFSLAEYGSWEAAETAAAKWLRGISCNLPPETPRQGRMTVSNTSGVVCVHPSMHVVRKPTGAVYEYKRWTARWHDCPNKGGLAWYVTGDIPDDVAFVRAVLSLQLKTVNRTRVLERFEEIKGTKEHDGILALMK